ncbi:Tubulin beta-8 chain [Orchesella cincta]|uniref:Tubulin beta-8 chain n=1 Tax=Orchesella cincta TaxID=48709 RepID=A0A1D2MDI0_ORCCI|nr:Tubulin beta-8 chain [Orchesella cincta]
MREIVTVQIGSCGVNLGYSVLLARYLRRARNHPGTWWRAPASTLQNQLFIQRRTHLQLHPPLRLYRHRRRLLDACRSPLRRIFRPDNFIFAEGADSGAGNNWARGYYTLGPRLMDYSMDILRREVESCEYLTGFQICNSIGGGTGGAMSSLILSQLRAEYPKTVMVNYTVTPSAKISDTVVEPYNAVLSFPSLVKNSDLTICLDNEALYDICNKQLRLSHPTYDDLNLLMAKVMSGMSATYRFPARNHLSWSVMRCLAPSPRLHFFVPGFVPLYSRAVQPYVTLTAKELTAQMLGGNVLMASGVGKSPGKYLSAVAMFRGCNVSDLNVNELLCKYETKNSSQFVDWMPYHFMKGIVVTPPRGLRMSATFLANHTASGGLWARVHDRFNKIYKRKAFLHWYTGEGMDEHEFKEASEQLMSLVKEYKAAEGSPPPGWKSPEDNPVFKKVLEEEKMVRVIDIVTIEPRYAILKVFRRSIQCVNIWGFDCMGC